MDILKCKRTIKRIWAVILLLSIGFIVLFALGRPMAANMFTKQYYMEYPGPVHIGTTSFPFSVYCLELDDKFYTHDFPRYYDIESIFFNSDTLYIRGIDKPIPYKERFFQVTNGSDGEKSRVAERIVELASFPDLQGKNYKHLYINHGPLIMVGEIIIILLICQFLFVLIILYWRLVCLIWKQGDKTIHWVFIALLTFFSSFLIYILWTIVQYALNH